MNYIHCKDCDKKIGKENALTKAHEVLGNHFKETGHREIQIFRWKLAYEIFLSKENKNE